MACGRRSRTDTAAYAWRTSAAAPDTHETEQKTIYIR